MSQQAISTADLRKIENNLVTIANGIRAIDSDVTVVDKNVRVVYDELGALAKEFKAYVIDEKRRWEVENATTRLGNVRQELETKYGHYSEVRRTATGILQATDLGIVSEGQIVSTAEELMISCPDYWLAPALVALAAWINDNREVAEKALKEALFRDNEKTSLFFGLVCRRAGRHDAALRWIKRYLVAQDPQSLGRETVVVLDAYASGLFQNDAENAIAKQLGDWLEVLSADPAFADNQVKRWRTALSSKTVPLSAGAYPYLRQYSRTWPQLCEAMEGAALHQVIFDYFEGILSQPTSQEAVKRQLDNILTSLVSSFDEEELPLRREERLCQLIIEFDGNTARAKQSADAERGALAEKKDFAQTLTDIAMHPEVSHSSAAAQKFALAFSHSWVFEAYTEVSLENQQKNPDYIEVNIDSFNDRTQDGSDEPRLLVAFESLVESERAADLEKAKLTAFEQYCLAGGAACAGVGALAIIIGLISSGLFLFIGILAVIAGIGAVVKHFSRKKAVEAERELINKKYDEKREKGLKVLKAVLAEVVDFRREFAKRNEVHDDVRGLIGRLSPEEYVKSLSSSGRKIGS